VALLVGAEPIDFDDLAAKAGLDECAQVINAAECIVAGPVARAQRQPRPVNPMTALLELDLAAAHLARVPGRQRRLRRTAYP
jgi:hypothetical protein